MYWVAAGTPSGPLTLKQDKAFSESTVIFVGLFISVLGFFEGVSVLGDRLIDASLRITST